MMKKAFLPAWFFELACIAKAFSASTALQPFVAAVRLLQFVVICF